MILDVFIFVSVRLARESRAHIFLYELKWAARAFIVQKKNDFFSRAR